ncbi:MAG: ParB/RepB/Spo0J family partition protein [Candidatus Thiodiazotropha sp. (ex Lucinoma aequizonata)]|nr:ParB/RepB/Spo0J family partition protein [Candidatus Thiodiazotropha sp. (ex Lucinoma aequizonata)]MCU7887683.1 ParB/RepB/Spo0J family partition protein [Candidatus Thiodiazotropha sp. (ex Lucinoma aequizonata)]MCU7897001.1 ParB/RepB/Spo0J family partition protein [Candidatus Thiodiazotropha sp. (ex Lucinoma aequizonata)]MCU7900175.1 ParB/RepB/Spo0J family partition protein [Candidatus Thiodiazotropha sp. (ex Lucinoma aequizonata)]MCU7901426.1 ParB/RepB/Spo0J family partition protein [Candid
MTKPKPKRQALNIGVVASLAKSVNKKATDSHGQAPDAEIDVSLLTRGRHQPRHDFDPLKMKELADSIAAHGVIQPIVIRPIKDAKKGVTHEIIAGERRWRAIQQAGLTTIPVVYRDVDNETALALSLIENINRDDLTPTEEAAGIARLKNEFKLSNDEIAKITGKHAPTITHLLAISALPTELMSKAEEVSTDITALYHLSHVHKIAPKSAVDLVADYSAGKLKGSVRNVFAQYAKMLGEGDKQGVSTDTIKKDIATMDENTQQRMTLIDKALGVKNTRIKHNANNTTITLTFAKPEEIDHFISMIDD